MLGKQRMADVGVFYVDHEIAVVGFTYDAFHAQLTGGLRDEVQKVSALLNIQHGGSLVL
jgi:hypothetical protein